jgi:heme-degrading monooxygenase HmoA
MYASIRIYDDAEGLADAVAAHRAEILGLLDDIAGFRSYHIVRTGPTSAISVTVCDDEAGAEASNQTARAYIAANLGELSIGSPEVHVGEVTMAS